MVNASLSIAELWIHSGHSGLLRTVLLSFIALANICPWPSQAILSNFFEEQCFLNNPQYLSGLSRALFSTTFLEMAVFD